MVAADPQELGTLLRRFITMVGMDEPRNRDAQDVERDHGRGEDAHVQNIGGWSNDGGDDEDAKNGIANVAPHPTRADDAHERKEKNQNRHFEDYAEPDNDRQKQRTVFRKRDHRLEILSVADQKNQGLGQNYFVAKVSARQKKSDCASHERHHIPLLVAVEAWRNETPQLVKHKRRGYE